MMLPIVVTLSLVFWSVSVYAFRRRGFGRRLQGGWDIRFQCYQAKDYSGENEPAGERLEKYKDCKCPGTGEGVSGELVELLGEDIKFQRETEERSAQERMERLFSLLERMVNK